MTNLNALTLDQLLERVQIIDDLMPSLTMRGLEKAQDELSAIEAELDSRMPGCEFQALLDGFEPVYQFDFEFLPDDYGLQPNG